VSYCIIGLVLSDCRIAICFLSFVLYVLINCFVFLNYSFYVCFLILYVCFLFYGLCFGIVLCIGVPHVLTCCSIFMCKFTDHCHQLQLIKLYMVYRIMYHVSYYFMSCHVVLCRVVSCRVVSCHVTSRNVTSHHIV
jgi:hypothetical protein